MTLVNRSACNLGHVSTNSDIPIKAPDGQRARPRLLAWQDEMNSLPPLRFRANEPCPPDRLCLSGEWVRFQRFPAGLRNYLTHHRLPIAQSRQTFSSQSFSVTFTLVRQLVQEWSRWKIDARARLASQGEQIEIVPVIDGYARIAGAFDN